MARKSLAGEGSQRSEREARVCFQFGKSAYKLVSEPNCWKKENVSGSTFFFSIEG
jgi:hypothetical protein